MDYFFLLPGVSVLQTFTKYFPHEYVNCWTTSLKDIVYQTQNFREKIKLESIILQSKSSSHCNYVFLGALILFKRKRKCIPYRDFAYSKGSLIRDFSQNKATFMKMFISVLHGYASALCVKWRNVSRKPIENIYAYKYIQNSYPFKYFFNISIYTDTFS